ncbi:DUF881 domain-containing protein [Aquipuribacter nitratireducens]|uniref:DUF881 domain-containing protein n=1 Tax=Aquipuribacter nitratireducens TaxID=650104 RepID=A0ABW0GPM6_9MICO
MTTTPPAPPAAPPPRRGIVARLRRQGPGIGVALTLAAAGMLFVAGGTTAQGTDLRDDSADLAGLVRGEAQEAEQVAVVVESLRGEVETLEEQAGRTDPALEARLLTTSEAAGMVPVTGPAVRVVIDDADPSSNRAQRARSLDDLVVHQEDVQGVVNALWRGGAEAMMLMDQRVISTSAVRCVGNTLSLQGRPYSPPYVVTAVGDVAQMQAALEASEAVRTYRQYVETFGLGYEVSVLEEAELPAYTGPLELRHASVVS